MDNTSPHYIRALVYTEILVMGYPLYIDNSPQFKEWVACGMGETLGGTGGCIPSENIVGRNTP